MKKLSSFISPVLPALAAAVILTAGTASAQTLVTYTIENSSNRDAATNVNTTLLTSASDLTHVGQTPGTSSTFTNVATGTVTGGTASTGTAAGTQRSVNYTSDSSSFSRTEYMAFTLTPQAAGIKLDTISFDFAAGGSGNRFFVLEYSFNGFTSPTSTPISLGSGTSGNNAYTRATFDLDSTLTTSPVEFRFFGYRDGNASATVRFDNIQVNAVPEPSTFAFLIGGLGMLIGFRRSRRR